tara:strand:- start:159 stop:509 length:351 start_codon:yes stop_codon:yes gene_type:complete
MERKGLSFHESCDLIEQKYGLPPLPFEKEEDGYSELSFREKKPTFDSMKHRVGNLLSTQRIEKAITLSQFLALWEVFNMIGYKVESKAMTEDSAIDNLVKVKSKIFQYIKVSAIAK